MFGKKLQNTVNKALTPAKAQASNSFMSIISSDLKDARKEIETKRSRNAGDAYSEALKLLAVYKANPDIEGLEKAANKFIEVLEFNKDHAPSLFYLSYVFYALGDEEKAMKYIKMAESLVPELPPDLLKYKEAVSKRLNKKLKAG